MTAAACVALALVGVAAVSPYALFTVLIELIRAGVVLAPPALAGLWLVPLLRLGRLPLRWHLLLGAALGLGGVALLVLGLGLAGLLQRGLWIGLLLTMAAAGAVRLAAILRESGAQPAASTAFTWLPLLIAPFLAMGLLAAATSPGQIWSEEGFGYDVLEYHLALPKAYHEAGRITYVAENVYANFPANVEMLYLLAMVVHGDPVEAGTTANMIHLLLGVLAVAAAWATAREWSPAAGVVALVALGSVGWMPYLAGLAYVEHGMLLFGLVGLGTLAHRLSRKADSPTDDTSHLGWIVAAGLAAGLACGCKYTAVPMITLPLAIVAALVPRRSPRAVAFGLLVFVAAATAAFAPWLAKNRAMTGSPVFPQAASVFPASPAGWGEAEADRWARGHAPRPEEAPLSARLGLLWHHVAGDPIQRFGPLILLAGFAGLIRRRLCAVDLALLIVLAVQLVIWLGATHLYGRFAAVMLMPLTLLAARGVGEGARAARVWRVVLAAGCAWNAAFAAALLSREPVQPLPASAFYEGQIPGLEHLALVNDELPADAKVLLVGEARVFYYQRPIGYAVVFNRHPLSEALDRATSDHDLLDRLREAGYSHMLVNWPEVARLAGTYGLDSRFEPALFGRLEAAGLRLRERFAHPVPERAARGAPYVDVYELPARASNSTR